MKRTIYILIFTFFAINVYAQMGEWTWMNGDSTANSLGHYGTQGVFDSLNTPPGLYEACEWTDKQGNFWLFGGVGYNQASCYSDLWKFNPTINKWVWVKGPGIPNQLGIYGTQGVPSPINNPDARGWGALTWIDTLGNLWLFGGRNIMGSFNDLWKYSIILNEWTWMAGTDTINGHGSYGYILTSTPLNCPPARCETSASWTDNTNCLWMFGGTGSGGYLSDMWKFDISINQWTWMKGPNIPLQPGVYGVKGISDSLNIPSSRWCYAKWKDNNGNFWFYGGVGSAYHNDMWLYTIVTNQWTWISGTNLNNDTVSIGSFCNSDTNNISNFRSENRACWTRACNNFVTFGGLGNGIYNDLWNFNAENYEWTWIGGSIIKNQPSHYGFKTISDPINIPNGRIGSIGWMDISGNLWLFGGESSMNSYNDIWRFIPDTSCPHLGCIGVGISEYPLSKSEINIYPNPNEGNFIMSYNLSFQRNELRIIDVFGSIVYKGRLINKDGKETIDISNLSKGVYILQIINEREYCTKKLIIQ